MCIIIIEVENLIYGFVDLFFWKLELKILCICMYVLSVMCFRSLYEWFFIIILIVYFFLFFIVKWWEYYVLLKDFLKKELYYDELDMSVKLIGFMKCVICMKLIKWKYNIV